MDSKNNEITTFDLVHLVPFQDKGKTSSLGYGVVIVLALEDDAKTVLWAETGQA